MVFCILLYVGQTPSIGTLIRFIEKDWNHVAKPQVFLHDNGYLIVKFVNVDDRIEILYPEPHTLNNRQMIINSWTPEFKLQTEMLRVIL